MPRVVRKREPSLSWIAQPKSWCRCRRCRSFNTTPSPKPRNRICAVSIESLRALCDSFEMLALRVAVTILVIPSGARNLRRPAAGKNEIPRCARNDKCFNRAFQEGILFQQVSYDTFMSPALGRDSPRDHRRETSCACALWRNAFDSHFEWQTLLALGSHTCSHLPQQRVGAQRAADGCSCCARAGTRRHGVIAGGR